MTPKAQSAGGGADSYRNFYNGLTSVDLLSAKADGNQVTAVIRFVTTSGRRSTEEYRLTLVGQGRQLLIDNFDNRGAAADPGGGEDDGEDG
jgi:hypothetical protein